MNENSPKNIVLLADGTGNSAGKFVRTNVWRLYDALDAHDEKQMAFYHDGVGSREFALFKLLGGVFGFGLKRNVLDLYKTLCRCFREGDRIYLFGFSRGAFTVRILAGLVSKRGLVCGEVDDDELEQIAKAQYSLYREGFDNAILSSAYRSLYRVYRGFRPGAPQPEPTTHPEIEFLGVWDTVAAYGFPIDELATVWHELVFSLRFPDHDLSPKVRRACHALSVDDERRTFHPLLWNEATETNGRIEQAWFAGAHADVGGGYAHDRLSLVSLDWMVSKVEAANADNGLKVLPLKREAIRNYCDWHGRQHDSRSGLGAFYRYAPRDIERLCHSENPRVTIEEPILHRGVLERIEQNIVPYSPAGIPARYRVSFTRGNPREYEDPDETEERVLAMRSVWDIVAWRRWLYRAFLVTTLVIAGSVLWFSNDDSPTDLSGSRSLDTVTEVVKTVLPSFAHKWIDNGILGSTVFWGCIAILVVLMWLQSRASRQTRRLSTQAWMRLKRRGPKHNQ